MLAEMLSIQPISEGEYNAAHNLKSNEKVALFVDDLALLSRHDLAVCYTIYG